MEIRNEGNGRKRITAAYKQYLVGNAQGEDKDKIIAHSVLVPEWASADEWKEVGEEEAQRISFVPEEIPDRQHKGSFHG